MSASNFQPALKQLLSHEGGFSWFKKDPKTFYGITERDFPNESFWPKVNRILEQHKITQSFTVLDRAYREIQQIINTIYIDPEVQSEIASFYRREFWNKSKCDELPGIVDRVVFNLAVNMGIPRVNRFLQTAVSAVADGIVGPKTLAAVANADPLKVKASILEQARQYYIKLAEQEQYKPFLNGWLNRLDNLA